MSLDRESRDGVSSATLLIGDPLTHSSAPSSLQFQRLREVEIDWLDLIDANVATRIRALTTAPVRLGTLDYIAAGWQRSGIDVTANLVVGPEGALNVANVFLDKERRAECVHLVLRTDSGIRWYVPLKADGSVFKGAELPNPVTLASLRGLLEPSTHAWQLASLEAADAEKTNQQIEILDMSVRDILENYERADQIEQVYSQLLSNMPPINAALWGDDAALADLRKKLVQFSSQKAFARAEKLRLSSDAKERGYVLALEDFSVTRPDTGQPVPYSKGNLYIESLTTVTWEVTETRTVYQYDEGACGGSATPVQVPVKVAKSATMPVYKKVTYVNDPVLMARERLATQGFQVVEAEQEDQGWMLNDGTALELLIERCSRDETFRRSCAVILHYRVTDALSLFPEHKVLIVKRPLPGVSPATFPKVFIREGLTYNVLWKGTELGPLVGSVNLAPGEERSITATRTFSEEVTTVSSRKSLLEETTASSQDFASELEKEFSNETSKSSTSSTSMGLSGSYGPIGGSFSQSNSSTTSIKSAAKELNKIARKTAQSFNRKVQAETSVSTSSKTNVQQTDSSTANVKNTNPGRTLNLLIYQINNLFQGGVFLNDIHITVSNSVEMIANTGIFSRRTVRLHELEKVVDLLAPSRLPFTPNAAVLANPTEKYWKPLIKAFLDTLQDEYGDESFGPPSPSTHNASQAFDSSAMILRFDNRRDIANSGRAAKRPDRIATSPLRNTDPTELLKELRDVLQSIIIKAEPIVSEQLAVASGGFYLDGQTGVNPLLEPYAEAMRELEVSRVSAEVQLLRLRAIRLGESSANYIVNALADGLNLTLQLRFPVASNRRMRIYYAEQEVNTFGAQTGVSTYSVAWARTSDQKDLEKNLSLYDEQEKAYLVYLPPLSGM